MTILSSSNFFCQTAAVLKRIQAKGRKNKWHSQSAFTWISNSGSGRRESDYSHRGKWCSKQTHASATTWRWWISPHPFRHHDIMARRQSTWSSRTNWRRSCGPRALVHFEEQSKMQSSLMQDEGSIEDSKFTPDSSPRNEFEAKISQFEVTNRLNQLQMKSHWQQAHIWRLSNYGHAIGSINVDQCGLGLWHWSGNNGAIQEEFHEQS